MPAWETAGTRASGPGRRSGRPIMSWDYGPLVAEVYELDKPVGSTFRGLRYYTRQLAEVPGRAADPRRRRAPADHRAGGHALLGARPVPVDPAGHAHCLRPGGQPDDQLPAVREVARRRPGRHRVAAVPAAVLEPGRVPAPP